MVQDAWQNRGLIRKCWTPLKNIVVMDAQDFNDAMLTVFMSGMTNGVNTVNDMVEKVNIAYDRSTRRRSAF